MQLPHRKTTFPVESVSMKARKNNNLPIFVAVFSIFLFGIFMYNEDVKSIAEFPFSTPKAQKLQEDESKQSTPVQESKQRNPIQETKERTPVQETNQSDSVQETKQSEIQHSSLSSRADLEETQLENGFEETQEPVDLKEMRAKWEKKKAIS